MIDFNVSNINGIFERRSACIILNESQSIVKVADELKAQKAIAWYRLIRVSEFFNIEDGFEEEFRCLLMISRLEQLRAIKDVVLDWLTIAGDIKVLPFVDYDIGSLCQKDGAAVSLLEQ